MVEWPVLVVPRGCLQFVIVVFPDHTHLLFSIIVAHMAKETGFLSCEIHYLSIRRGLTLSPIEYY